MKNKTNIVLAVFVAVFSIFSFASSAQALSMMPPVACPAGYTCTLLPECPVGYTCTPAPQPAGCPAGYVCSSTPATPPTPVGTTAVVSGNPSLELLYDGAEETRLSASFLVTITAGSQGMLVDPSYANISFRDQSNARFQPSSYRSTAVLIPSSIYIPQNSDGAYILKPNQAALFTASATVNAKEMFAGTYRASLDSFQGVPTNSNTTNSKTIVGEVSPYISSITGPTIGLDGKTRFVEITGARFQVAANDIPKVYMDNVLLASNISYILSPLTAKITLILPANIANGLHTVYIVNSKGASNKVGFTVGTAVSASASVTSSALELEYATGMNASRLKASFIVTVDGGKSGVLIYETNPGVEFYSTTGNNTRVSSMMNSPVSVYGTGLNSTIDNKGQKLFIVPPGQKAKFVVASTVDPKQLFAGTYYASLISFYANTSKPNTDTAFQIAVGNNKTPNKTIVGEVSPYITGFGSTGTFTAGQGMTVVGQRLTSNVYIDNVLLTTGVKGDASNIGFMLPSNLTPGAHYIFVRDAATGDSNRVGFQIGSVLSQDSVTAYLASASEDRVGVWNVFGPGKSNYGNIASDWKWDAALNLAQGKNAESIEVISSNGFEGWSTKSGRNNSLGKDLYPLVLYVNGNKLNSAYNHQPYFGAGSHAVSLYGQPENTTFGGGIINIKFTDGTSIKFVIPASSIKPTTPVTPTGSLTIVSPNGGETLKDKQTYQIRWNSNNVPASSLVDISLLDNPTRFGNVVLSRVPNTGSANWVAAPLSTLRNRNGEIFQPSGNYVMSVSCSDNSCTVDDSNASFTIAPSVAVQPSLTFRINPNASALTSTIPEDNAVAATFDVDATGGDVNISQMSVGRKGTASLESVSIYDGSTLLSTITSFPHSTPFGDYKWNSTNLSLVIPKGVKKTLTLRANITRGTTGSFSLGLVGVGYAQGQIMPKTTGMTDIWSRNITIVKDTTPVPVPPTPESQQVSILPWSGPASIIAGEPLKYTLNWRGGPLAKSWRAFIHVVKDDGSIVVGNWFVPSPDTMNWSGSISTTNTVATQPAHAPGTYRVMAGLYDPNTPTQVPSLAAGAGVTRDASYTASTRYQVGTITIAAPVVTTPATTTPPVAEVPSSVTASAMTTFEDHAGMWNVFAPGKGAGNYADGIKGGSEDWGWNVKLTIGSAKTVKSMRIVAEGTNQAWSTENSSSFPLVVFRNGSQLNASYGASLGTYNPGTYMLKMFGQIDNVNQSGSKLTVVFTDSTSVTTSIAPAGVKPPSVSSTEPRDQFLQGANTGSFADIFRTMFFR